MACVEDIRTMTKEEIEKKLWAEEEGWFETSEKLPEQESSRSPENPSETWYTSDDVLVMNEIDKCVAYYSRIERGSSLMSCWISRETGKTLHEVYYWRPLPGFPKGFFGKKDDKNGTSETA